VGAALQLILQSADPERMRSLLPAFGAIVRAELFFAAILAVGVGGVAVWVAPKAIHALSSEPEPLGVVTIEGEQPDERRAVIEALRETLESCFAFVAVEHGALVLWESDRHDRGALNVDETLVIAHSPSLLTLSAVFVEDGGATEETDLDALLTESGLRRFRTSPNASSGVMATGVADVSIATNPGEPGELEVALTLTWEGDADDAQGEAGASRTTLRVRLRRIEGLGR